MELWGRVLMHNIVQIFSLLLLGSLLNLVHIFLKLTLRTTSLGCLFGGGGRAQMLSLVHIYPCFILRSMRILMQIFP